MSDRLEQIWKGFSNRSSLNLSGTSIDSTPRPALARQNEEQAPMLSQPMRVADTKEGSADPVGAALNAMHAAMASQKTSKNDSPKAFSGRNGSDLRRAMSHGDAAVTSEIEKSLFAAVEFTRSKTDRRSGDYVQFAAGRQDDWQRRKRKKFLGIF